MQENELEAPIATKVLRRLRTATESGRVTWVPGEDYVPDRDWLSGRFALAYLDDAAGVGAGGVDAAGPRRFIVELQLGGPLSEGDELGPMVEIYTEDDPRCCVITDVHDDETVLELLFGLAEAVAALDVFPHPSYPMDTEDDRVRAIQATFALMDEEDGLYAEDDARGDETPEKSPEDYEAEIEVLRRALENDFPQLRFRTVPEPFDGAVLARFVRTLNSLST